MRPVNERIAVVEQKLSSMETKVDEMHAVLMQAYGVKWAVLVFAGLVGFLIGVGTFLIQIGKFRWSILGILFLFGVALVVAAQAHSWYPANCCSDRDCAPLDQSRVRPTSEGYFIDEVHFIPHARVMIPFDGEYHGCFSSTGVLVCFFAPKPSV
jgi:hypothetical protein